MLKKVLLTTGLLSVVATSAMAAEAPITETEKGQSIVRTVLLGVLGYQFGGSAAANVAGAVTGVLVSNKIGEVKAPDNCPVGATVEAANKIVTAPFYLVGSLLGIK